MEFKKKANRENNNTSLPVQIQQHQKLIEEVNKKYRQFTSDTEKALNKASILAVEKIEKMEEFLRSIGLEQHLLVHTSDVDETDHSQSKLRCSLPHQNKKICKINQNSSIIPGLNVMPAKKSNKILNIVHIPTWEMLLCDKCDVKFGSKMTLKRHKTHQHASYKLICPECNYATTRKDNMRRHLINTHKLKEVGTIIDNLQRIQTEQKNAKIRVQAPPSAPNPNHNNNELKQLKGKGTNPYIYA